MPNIPLVCTSCGKQKLYVDTETGKYLCFVCPDVRGKFRPKEIRTLLWENNQEAPAPRWQNKEIQSTPLRESGLRYLIEERGVDPNVLAWLPVEQTTNGILFRFPGFDSWQVRRWAGEPKWIISPDPAPETVYLVELHDTDRIVLVEGIVDALRVGEKENAAALMGRKGQPAPAQLEFLGRRYKRALWIPDGDVSPYAWVNVLPLVRSYFEEVDVRRLDYGKDPADIGAWELGL